jgi:protein-S-isoprenylcysteine O-methyltransferase Ste14
MKSPPTPLSNGADLQLMQRKRKRVLVGGIAFVLVLLAVSDTAWRVPWPQMHRLIQGVGLLLILVCILGRTWCTLYIGGQKKRGLVTAGPYSVVRNPLYVFTLLGATGAGALSGSITIALLCAVFAGVVFASVVRQEEQFLLAAFPADYPAYMARVPRFWPRPSAWQDAEQLIVRPDLVNRTFFEASLFLLAAPLVALRALLRDLGWLPILLHLP